MSHSDSETSSLQSRVAEEYIEEPYVNGDYIGGNPLAEASFDSSSEVDAVDLDEDHKPYPPSKHDLMPRISSRTDSDWKEESTRAVTESFEEHSDSMDDPDLIIEPSEESQSSTATFTPRQSRELFDTFVPVDAHSGTPFVQQPPTYMQESTYLQEPTFRGHQSTPVMPPAPANSPPESYSPVQESYPPTQKAYTPPPVAYTPPSVATPVGITSGNRLDSTMSGTLNRSVTQGDAYVRNITSRGTRVVSCEQLERPEDTVRYVEVPMVEHTTKTVPVRQVQQVERRVPKTETHYVTKEVEQLTIQFKEKFVEVEQVEVVEKKVPVVIVEDRLVEVIREVPRVEIQQVEKIVEIPEIVEVPKPYKVVNENRFTRFHDEDTHILVAQTVQPVVTLNQEETEVELLEYEAEPVPVDIHVPTLVSGAVKLEKKPTEMRVVSVPAAQYNSILSQLNTHLPQQHRDTLPYQRDSSGDINFLPERANYHHLTTPGQTPRCLPKDGQLHQMPLPTEKKPETQPAPRPAQERPQALRSTVPLDTLQPAAPATPRFSRPAVVPPLQMPAHLQRRNGVRYEIPGDSLSLTVKPRPQVVA